MAQAVRGMTRRPPHEGFYYTMTAAPRGAIVQGGNSALDLLVRIGIRAWLAGRRFGVLLKPGIPLADVVHGPRHHL